MNESLRGIAAKASSIQERLTSPDLISIIEPVDDEIVEARMLAWLAAAASGDRATFGRRLEWDGLDEYSARRAVRPVRLRPDVPLPRWALTLGEVLQLAGEGLERERCLDDEDPIPFEEVLIPFVTWARFACELRAGLAYSSFNTVAHAALERQLLVWLSSLAARTLALEFSLELSAHESPLDVLLQPEPSREVYDLFVARMRSCGLILFFEEYSALARALSTTTELWVVQLVRVTKLPILPPATFSSSCVDKLRSEVTSRGAGKTMPRPHMWVRSRSRVLGRGRCRAMPGDAPSPPGKHEFIHKQAGLEPREACATRPRQTCA